VWAAFGAILCYAQARPAAPRSISDFVGFVLPWRLLLHASARLDLWFMLVGWLARPILVAPFVFSTVVAGKCLALPLAFFSVAPEITQLSLAASISLILALIVATDFARFFAHYLVHRISRPLDVSTRCIIVPKC